MSSKPPVRRRGRPFSAHGPLRVMVRGKLAEVAQWKASAEADGMPLATWIRQHLNRAAQRQQGTK